MTDFEKLYKYVKKHEDLYECPVFYVGYVMINTNFDEISMETPEGAIATRDFEDIQELLSKSGVCMKFKGNTPIISRL